MWVVATRARFSVKRATAAAVRTHKRRVHQTRQGVSTWGRIVFNLPLGVHVSSGGRMMRLGLALMIKHVHSLVGLAVINSARVVLVTFGSLNFLLFLLRNGNLSRKAVRPIVGTSIDRALSIVAAVVVQHRVRVELSHTADVVICANVARGAGWSIARAPPSVILIMSRRSATNDHLG